MFCCTRRNLLHNAERKEQGMAREVRKNDVTLLPCHAWMGYTNEIRIQRGPRSDVKQAGWAMEIELVVPLRVNLWLHFTRTPKVDPWMKSHPLFPSTTSCELAVKIGTCTERFTLCNRQADRVLRSALRVFFPFISERTACGFSLWRINVSARSSETSPIHDCFWMMAVLTICVYAPLGRILD